jgi:hypothetical protein
METVTGVFESQEAAERAFADLSRGSHFNRDNLILLTPDGAPAKIQQVPTDEGEQPGMGSTIGGVVGGAVGLATGAFLANVILPGVGPVLTLSLSAGSGLGGAALGALGGSAAERALSNGLPKDELFFYEDALRRRCSLVMAMAESEDAANRARSVFERDGADSIDAAREKWWIGLRDGEAKSYGEDTFAGQESIYRAGFEAALRPSLRNKRFDEAESDLRTQCPNEWSSETFRRGFERGRRYLDSLENE